MNEGVLENFTIRTEKRLTKLELLTYFDTLLLLILITSNSTIILSAFKIVGLWEQLKKEVNVSANTLKNY